MSTRTDWPQDEFLAWLDGLARRLDMTDHQLAGRLGIGHTLISGWRNGRQRPSIETLLKVALAIREDPRKLWVLAGWMNPIDVGLLDSEVPAAGPVPEEIEQLLEVYRRDEMGDEDRAAVRGHVRLLVLGVLADLEARRESGSGVRRKRVG